jgi:RNA polymerase sigma-70 factor, ECF subfamily
MKSGTRHPRMARWLQTPLFSGINRQEMSSIGLAESRRDLAPKVQSEQRLGDGAPRSIGASAQHPRCEAENMTNELTSACWEESDGALVAAAKNREGGAFESLMSRHKGKIFATAFRITRNREDALDVVQQSFHKAFVHLHKFQGKSSFLSWLTRIAINEALMHLRKSRALSEISLEDMKSDTGSLPTEIPDRRKSPAEIYEQNEKKRILAKAINRLSLDSRAALLLRLEERSIEEAAEILGVGSGTLKARLFRGREKLRVLLTPSLGLRRTPSVAA